MRLQRGNTFILLIMLSLLQLSFFYSATDLKNKTHYTSSSVLEQIKTISELNTVEMYFHDIIDYKDAKYFHDMELPFTRKTFIFTVKARVKAGINLEELKVDNIKILDNKTIKIKIPKSEITSKEILSYNSYDEKDGLFNEVKNEDTFKALEQFQANLEKQAIEMDILEKAEDNAKNSITSLLKALGFEEVVIE